MESLLRELLDAKRGRKSEQLSREQMALFAALWQERQAAREPAKPEDDSDSDDRPGASGGVSESKKRSGGRPALPRHLKRERIVHDLAEVEKHCASCEQQLRPIGEERCERYEYVPAAVTVVEEVCLKYACVHGANGGQAFAAD